MIGSQVKVVGEISGDEDIEVLGRVEGTILLKKDLVISGAGSVDAKIHAKVSVPSDCESPVVALRERYEGKIGGWLAATGR